MFRRIPTAPFLAACGLAALLPAFAAAGPTVVEAGQTLSLSADLVLTGDDTLDVRGTPEKRCVLAGNGHRVRTAGTWTGSVRVRHCDVRGLGGPATLSADGSRIAAEFPALDLTAAGTGSIVIEHCDFDASAAVHVRNDGTSTTTFRANTIRENTL